MMKMKNSFKNSVRGFGEIRALYLEYYNEKSVLNSVLVTPVKKARLKVDSSVRSAIKRKLVEERMARWLQSLVMVVFTGAALWLMIAGYILNQE